MEIAGNYHKPNGPIFPLSVWKAAGMHPNRELGLLGPSPCFDHRLTETSLFLVSISLNTTGQTQ
jgi:hypothetical protein